MNTRQRSYITDPPRSPDKCHYVGNATGINDSGEIIGTATNPKDHSDYDAYIWGEGKGKRGLNTHPDEFVSTVPKSINSASEVVGNFLYKSDAEKTPRIFHWNEQDGMVDVAKQIDPEDPLRDQIAIEGFACSDTYTSNCVPKINNHGVILTTGHYKTDPKTQRAFLLEPVRQ